MTGWSAAIKLIVKETGRVVAERMVRAASLWSRLRGLLGKSGLEAGEALLIPDCRGIHTCGMRFAIDVVFLAADGTVIRVVERLEPWGQESCAGASCVIELAAGAARAAGLAPGLRLTWEE